MCRNWASRSGFWLPSSVFASLQAVPGLVQQPLHQRRRHLGSGAAATPAGAPAAAVHAIAAGLSRPTAARTLAAPARRHRRPRHPLVRPKPPAARVRPVLCPLPTCAIWPVEYRGVHYGPRQLTAVYPLATVVGHHSLIAAMISSGASSWM